MNQSAIAQSSPTLGFYKLARTHTYESGKTHWVHDDNAILDLAVDHWSSGKPSGAAWSVPVPTFGFYCPVARLRPGEMRYGELAERLEGEDLRLSNVVFRDGHDMGDPAFVNLIFYPANEIGDEAEADWELVTVIASMVEDEPMHPATLLCNYFVEELDGGTKPKGWDDERFRAEFGRSVAYWSIHAMVIPQDGDPSKLTPKSNYRELGVTAGVYLLESLIDQVPLKFLDHRIYSVEG